MIIKHSSNTKKTLTTTTATNEVSKAKHHVMNPKAKHERKKRTNYAIQSKARHA